MNPDHQENLEDLEVQANKENVDPSNDVVMNETEEGLSDYFSASFEEDVEDAMSMGMDLLNVSELESEEYEAEVEKDVNFDPSFRLYAFPTDFQDWEWRNALNSDKVELTITEIKVLNMEEHYVMCSFYHCQ
jgi:hypothetical protein